MTRFEPLLPALPGEVDPVDNRRETARLQRNEAVRRYMEGRAEHPGFLLPWEELREDLEGYYYYVDLVTDEVTYREPKRAAEKRVRLYDRPEVVGFPPSMYFAPAEEKAMYVGRRALYVEYWRWYTSRRKASSEG